MISKLSLLAVFFLTACSFGPGNIQTRHSTDLTQRRIKRIAVLPPALPAVEQKKTWPGAPPEAKAAAHESPELLARFLYAAMAPLPDWQIVSESEVREVSQTVSPVGEGARIKKVGEAVYADAVIVGRVLRYRDRVGEEWGAQSPASVAFVLDLVDVRRGDIVWSARFDETQKPLSENIFALGDIKDRGIRWLTAEQLLAEGVRKAVAQLHQALRRTA